MTATTHSAEQDALFSLTAQLARQQIERGGSHRSARMKQLLLAADPDFDERSLGFLTFRDFLRAAEGHGFIRLVEAEVGPDLDVLPANVDASVRRTAPTRRQRIRSDLWQAFTQWRTDTIRFWDAESARAHVLPNRPRPGESTESDRLRARYSAGALIQIDPIAPNTVASWMRSFADGRPEPEREELRAALASATPYRSFVELARARRLSSAWHDAYATLVAEQIERWAAANALDLDPYGSIVTAVDEEANGTRRSADEAEIRAAVHRLVDRAPLAELLQLRFSVATLNS